MQGKRVYPNEEGALLLAEGEYGLASDGITWYCRPPNCHMGDLSGHEVIEHKDGTITVSPSILIEYGPNAGPGYNDWHGHLKNGIWSTC